MRRAESLLLRIAVYGAVGLTLAVLGLLMLEILRQGLPHLSWDLFAWSYSTENQSMLPALVNTLTMTVLALALAVPVGVLSAVYLVEYARRGNRFVRVIRAFTETLAAIPSVVYGLFGLLLFVGRLHWGYSLLSGALTLAIMILPVIMRTSEEALQAVPDAWREGGFGLGAGKLRTVFRIVLPPALPGIFSGILLSAGRIIGETTALIYTAGTVAQIAGLRQSGRTLSVHIFALWNEGLAQGEAYATAAVLLVLTLGLPALSARLSRRSGHGGGKRR